MSLQTILSTLAPGLLVRGNIVETGVEVHPPLLEIVICYGGGGKQFTVLSESPHFRKKQPRIQNEPIFFEIDHFQKKGFVQTKSPPEMLLTSP